MRVSSTHSNRKAHNWLIYDIGDQWLQEYTELYRGQLYDLGCGEMPFKDWLLQFADSYIGVDWANTVHELKADIMADLNEPLPIESEVADTVVSLSVMEHLREPQVMLSEAYRILKPGGALILQVPFMWRIHEAPHDYYRYTRFGLKYLLEKAGFAEAVIHPQTGFWVMWILKFNYQSKRLIRGPLISRVLIRCVLHAIWAANQRVATLLDKIWQGEEDTAGYFVIAKKHVP